MRKICKCLRDCALNLLDFMRGKADRPKLKTLLFGCLKPDELVSKTRLKRAKRKRKPKTSPDSRYVLRKGKHAVHHEGEDQHANSTTAPAPQVVHQRPTQATTHCVHKPMKPWVVIIPSGFGYGSSLELPVAPQPQHSRGLLGRPPVSLAHLNNGDQLPQQQAPLLPLQCQQALGNNSGDTYAGAQQLEHKKN